MVNNFYRVVFSLVVGWMSLVTAQAQVTWPDAQAMVAGGGSVADFGAFVQREQSRYAEIVRTANIRNE